MAKVLFVPTNSREVSQFSLVKNELEKNADCRVLAVSLGKNMEDLLQKKGFTYTRLKDYQTKNILHIIDKEKPEIVITHAPGYMFIGDIKNEDLLHS